jgi:4-amino-4-deoxy-L-arabinose transferase-like glycosyltransferase
MFYLAKRLCDQPVLSTLIMLLSPAFLVSGTTLMCDVFMMA